ncbi:uncharacterized protein LOC100215371 [Hydra vulgaris]|uniref:uncharacterized protein LOC100215371 n=1 Tax=Hydra vulgaris TaxID=6087 RepID=UPI0001925DAB|nr:uncharacterized protein LOC100215371 [Hydra vulgaris]
MAERINCIAVDSSKESDNAFYWYVENYHREDDIALLVHVQDSPNRYIETLVEGKGNHYDSEYRRFSKSEKVLERFKAKCVRRNIKFIPCLAPLQNNKGHTICNVAETHNATIIVTGQKCGHKLTRTLLRSTSENIMHHSHVPVLIIRLNDNDKQKK